MPVYDLNELSGVTTVRLGVTGVLQMVSESTLAVSRVRTSQLRRTVTYGSVTWVRTHYVWVLWEGHDMIRMLLTGCTVCVC
jgi:hypothetical protein